MAVEFIIYNIAVLKEINFQLPEFGLAGCMKKRSHISFVIKNRYSVATSTVQQFMIKDKIKGKPDKL